MSSIDVIRRDPMQPPDPKQRCTAHTKSGGRCGAYAIKGGTVCRMHGGQAPQVRNKARLRLLELVDPAIATLAREMANAQRSSDRQRAANSILDRAGVARAGTPEGEVARALLIDRLMQLRADEEQK